MSLSRYNVKKEVDIDHISFFIITDQSNGDMTRIPTIGPRSKNEYISFHRRSYI